jgi:hypothetical protein
MKALLDLNDPRMAQARQSVTDTAGLNEEAIAIGVAAGVVADTMERNAQG